VFFCFFFGRKIPRHKSLLKLKNLICVLHDFTACVLCSPIGQQATWNLLPEIKAVAKRYIFIDLIPYPITHREVYFRSIYELQKCYRSITD